MPGDESAGRVIPGLVGLVDVAPTLVRLGTGAVPGSFQGRDLFEAGGGPIFAQEQHVGNDLQSLVYTGEDGGIWKVIACNAKNPRNLPARSLFHLSEDPGEKKNLAVAGSSALQAALEKLASAMKLASRGGVPGKPVQIDEATQHRLQELGYLQDAPGM